MQRWVALIGIGFAVVAGVALAFGAYLVSSYEDAPVDPDWEVRGSRLIRPGAVTVRWSGTATLVFSDGETTWMTDGWFSRPGPIELFFGKIEPDVKAIEEGLAHNLVQEAAAVFPVHSHYDHAMDAPEVARRTGAVLLGSESTANIGRGWGLDESQIRVVKDREPIQLGRFTLTPIESVHFQFPDEAMREQALGDPEIREPLVPPVGAFDYKLGKAYVLHVAHPLGSFLVVGSAGFVEGALEDYEVDVVFLGVGGLGGQTQDYQEGYWRETVERTRPERIIPIHWDSLVRSTEDPFSGELKAATFLSAGSGELREFLQAKDTASPDVTFLTLPRYDAVVLFEPEPDPGGALGSRAQRASDGGETGEVSEPRSESTLTPREATHVRRSFWKPRTPRGSKLRELEQKAAEEAFKKGLISMSGARTQAEKLPVGDIGEDQLEEALEDATREEAADELLRDCRGNMWDIAKQSCDDGCLARNLARCVP